MYFRKHAARYRTKFAGWRAGWIMDAHMKDAVQLNKWLARGMSYIPNQKMDRQWHNWLDC